MLALRVAEAAPQAELLPDRADPDLLALVRVQRGESARPGDERLVAPIERRHACRAGFEGRPLPPALMSGLIAVATAEGLGFEELYGHDRRRNRRGCMTFRRRSPR